MIRRLCLIGVGLIGGSLVRGLREKRLCGRVVGCGRSLDNLHHAIKLGVIDELDADPASAVAGADMVVLATPLGAMPGVLARIAGHLDEDAVLTDVGSAKQAVIDAARTAFGGLPAGFVPGHPIAGTEHSGVEASFATLFENRRVILTPTASSAAHAIRAVTRMWEAVGAEVVEMSAAHHDEVLAATSHLPHVLAFALVDALARMQDRIEIFRYAAGGFRDFTRIASSDPTMWRDICLANRDAILKMLDSYTDDLGRLRAMIAGGDGERIAALFERAKDARDGRLEAATGES
jgi:prephenate dehydrogenase